MLVSSNGRADWDELINEAVWKFRGFLPKHKRHCIDDTGRESFWFLRPACKERHVYFMKFYGGGKTRFQVLWPDWIRSRMLALRPDTPEWWRLFCAPIEIRVLQGGSGGRNCGEGFMIKAPHSHQYFYHASDVKACQSI